MYRRQSKTKRKSGSLRVKRNDRAEYIGFISFGGSFGFDGSDGRIGVAVSTSARFAIVDHDAQPRVELLEALAVLWMRKGVDDRVVEGRRLGANDGQLGHEWRDERRIVPRTHHGDGRERSPGEDPQQNVDDGHFGGPDLGRNGQLLILVDAPERSDVHLLGLTPQLLFMVKHGLDDEEIAADDDDDGASKLEEARRQDVALVVHCGRVRVERTPFDR